MANEETYSQWSRISVLEKEILDDAGITTAVDWIETSKTPANTDIHFVSAISAGERTALDTLMGSHTAPTTNTLKITSNATDDNEGIPSVAANNTATHTITIQKVDENGDDIASGSETINIEIDSSVKKSDGQVTLSSGAATLTIGPHGLNRDVVVRAYDPTFVIQSSKETFRFYSADDAGWLINSDNVYASDTIVLSATADTLITDMTITPGKGDYLVFFSFNGHCQAGGDEATISVYANGTQNTSSERTFATDDWNAVSTQCVVEGLEDGQAIEAKFRNKDGGKDTTFTKRGIVYIKLR